MEEVLYQIVQVCTMLMELFGVCVLVFTAIRCFVRWIKRETEVPSHWLRASRLLWNSSWAARYCGP